MKQCRNVASIFKYEGFIIPMPLSMALGNGLFILVLPYFVDNIPYKISIMRINNNATPLLELSKAENSTETVEVIKVS